MPVILTVNGVNYNYPKLGDENWGQDATNWAVGITQLVNAIDTLLTNTITAGIFEFADGSAATPSGRFQNSLATGFYRVSSNVFGFTAAGVAAGQISSSGLLQWKSGSIGAPAFSFFGDPDTGASNPNPNQYSISTGGLEALRLDSAQGAHIFGDLTVDGNTTLNSVTFQVTDKNLTLNLNGTDASAEGGGLTIFRNPSVSGSIVFDSTKASFWKAGLVGSEIELLNVSSTQTITGKTFGQSILNNANNTYDLGTSANRWRDLYISGSIDTLGVLYVSNGTAALPSYSFVNDHTTGAYLPGVGQYGISTAGVERIDIGSNGLIRNFANIATPAGAETFLVQNSNTGALAHSTLRIATAGGASANASLWFNTLSLTSWAIGIDAADSGKFKLNNNVAQVGSGEYMSWTTPGAFVLGAASSSQSQVFNGGSFTWNLTGTSTVTLNSSALTVSSPQIRGSDGTNSIPFYSFNAEQGLGFVRDAAGSVAMNSNDASQGRFIVRALGSNASAQLYILNADGSTADTKLGFNETSTAFWSLGRDTSDSGKFKLSKGSFLGTNDYLTFDTSGKATVGEVNGVQVHDVNGSVRVASSATLGVTLDPLKSVSLLDAQAAPIQAFALPATGNEHIVIHYSIVRGATNETGTMHLTHDGTTAKVEAESAYQSDSGIDFTADISAGNVRILYTSTNTGSGATLKYFLFRWGN